jgi:plasmid replication initiation protein
MQLVRHRREAANQRLGFASRPFVLCGLPVRCPPRSTLLYERRNGLFTLQITGCPDLGLPFGQDRFVPIFLATLAVRQQCQTIRFKSAAQMFDTFGMANGGKEYRRLVAAFERIFGTTIFFGTESTVPPRDAAVIALLANR